MNLWAKRIKLLPALAGVLLFFSCQEETSILGYKNPNSKFKVSYVEIPIGSSVFLRDSLRTSNYTHTGEINRLLVGNYVDDAFGNVTASAFTQFFTTSQLKVGSTAAFDSISLELRFDLYNYGSAAATSQNISVHELTQELKADSLDYLFNKTNLSYSGLLGTKKFTINPTDFDKFAASSEDKDTVITIRLPLDKAFGQRVFNSALKYRDATTAADSTFVRFRDFVKEFKGIVVKPEGTDKIVGFNPSASQSKIVLHYHEDDKDSLSLTLAFTPVIGFNQIKSDKSGTELSGLTQYYQEAQPASNKRYIQSGVGILTKLDFSKFYEFADTVPYVLINEAILSIESVEPSTTYKPPAQLALRVLSSNNRMKKFSITRQQDAEDFVAYKGYLRYDIPIQTTAPIVDDDSVFYVEGDKASVLNYSSTNASYSAILSLFCQQLTLENDKTNFRTFVLYPGSQALSTPAGQNGSKSVNRVVFPKDKIKLKITYTKPTTER